MSEGGCLCGAVRYRIGPFRIAEGPLCSCICHCVSCRRASGAPSVAWLTVERAQFEILSGNPLTYGSSPGVTRRFCGRCGSALTYENAESPASIDVTTITLDDPNGFPPTAEVWLEDKVAWQPTAEELRHYRGSSDD
jgi:hypothetical protein